MYPSIHSENTQLETNKQTAQATVGSCGTTQPSLYKYHLKLAKPNDGSGIDVTTYKGHSTIVAATIKAQAGGLSVAEIVKRAKWKRASTFKKFSNKETPHEGDGFARTVLG
jgi:hypothetical protein